jgi:hypothetical protein
MNRNEADENVDSAIGNCSGAGQIQKFTVLGICPPVFYTSPSQAVFSNTTPSRKFFPDFVFVDVYFQQKYILNRYRGQIDDGFPDG